MANDDFCVTKINIIDRMRQDRDEALDALEGLARMHIMTDEQGLSYCAIDERKKAALILANYGRFRMVAVVGDSTLYGYWPENDPRRGEAA